MKKPLISSRKICLLLLSISCFVLHAQTSWKIINMSNSRLTNNKVTKVFQDKDGKVWVGTFAGLNIIDGDKWETYTKSKGLPQKTVNAIDQGIDGRIWVGTYKGLATYNGENWTTFQKDNGLINNKVYAVKTDSKGNVWVGTPKGVSVFDGQNWQVMTKANGLAHNFILDIEEDKDGRIWFATKKGVSVFDGRDWRSFDKADGLARNFVWAIGASSQGNLWFGTHTGAFSVYDGSNWEYLKKGSGYYDGTMVAYAFINGILWTFIGGPVAGGIFFTGFMISGALPSAANATRVYIDSQDNVWLAAQPKGAFMFDGQNWTSYNKKNGLPHKRVNDFLETQDGKMWFGTSNGIAVMSK